MKKTVSAVRSFRLVLAAALLPFLAACGGPGEEEKKAALDAVGDHADSLAWSEYAGGIYSPVRVEYVNLTHRVMTKKQHGIAIVIRQFDKKEGGPKAMTDPKQVLLSPPTFYQKVVCPPQEVLDRFEDFDIYINLLSEQFNSFYRIPCMGRDFDPDTMGK